MAYYVKNISKETGIIAIRPKGESVTKFVKQGAVVKVNSLEGLENLIDRKEIEVVEESKVPDSTKMIVDSEVEEDKLEPAIIDYSPSKDVLITGDEPTEEGTEPVAVEEVIPEEAVEETVEEVVPEVEKLVKKKGRKKSSKK